MRVAKKLTLLLGVLCAGCAPHPARPTNAPARADWNLTLDLMPRAPKTYDPTAFTVRVTDTAGHPVRGAAVTAALAMPAMEMGRNDVAAKETAVGIYTGTGRFTMAGHWQMTVTAAKTGGRAAKVFPVEVR